MLNKQYTALLDGCCHLLGIQDASALYTQGSLVLKDVAFSMDPSESEDDDSFSIFCDYGLIPNKVTLQAYQRLLEVNMLTCKTACFVLNPESEHILLHYTAKAAETNPQSLIKSLELCAEEALRWRKEFYLEKSIPAAQAKPGISASASASSMPKSGASTSSVNKPGIGDPPRTNNGLANSLLGKLPPR
jgi:Tir chaperone protein (CesT) family